MSDFAPIAIVGAGCVLPGAFDPEALWGLVRDRRSALAAVDPATWGLSPAAPGDAEGEIATAVGSPLDGFEARFDPRGFQVPADLLQRSDAGVRWTAEACRQALTGGGFDLADHPDGALILGNLGYPTRALADRALAAWLDAPDLGEPTTRFMSGWPAALVAKAVGFGGRALALDAACASALYAIKLACDRLHDGTADLALAGGLNASDDLCLHVGFTALTALSPSGRSRPFHREADGLIPARGAGVVALQRLEDAQDQGRPILGVIRGIGLSNDGKSPGLLVPDAGGQARAMRDAFAGSGLTPGDVSLVECHATGTQTGDRVEVDSLRAVYGDAADLPIGSLKSNLGHLITAAGAAGLIKVLGALREGIRPATLHLDAPIETPGPLRLLAEAEPWAVDGPRRAAVSAFGFGGNNAHLLVEEPPARRHRATRPRPAPPTGEVAVTGLAVIAGSAGSADAFAEVLDSQPADRHAEPFAVDAAALGIPPKDLADALPQQLLFLRTALDLEPHLADLPQDRTLLYVGMQCDVEAARYAARWRSSAFDPEVFGVSRTTAAGVVGCMPNVVANRLGRHLDLHAPNFVLSAEEASGTVALEAAARALRAGEVDAAIVGAVDLCAEPVHEQALAAAGGEAPGGDAAVVLILERRDEAVQAGRSILALLDTAAEAPRPAGDAAGPTGRTDLPSAGRAASGSQLSLSVGPGCSDLADRFGHPQAASGLLAVAAGVAACARSGSRSARIEVEALGGQRTTTVLRADPEAAPIGRFALADAPTDPKVPVSVDPHPAPLRPQSEEPAMMEPAPALPSARAVPSAAAARPGDEQAAAAQPDPGSTPTETPTPGATPAAAGHPSPATLRTLARAHQDLGATHRAYLARQAEAHARFTQLIQAAWGTGGATRSSAAPTEAPRPAPGPAANAPTNGAGHAPTQETSRDQASTRSIPTNGAGHAPKGDTHAASTGPAPSPRVEPTPAPSGGPPADPAPADATEPTAPPAPEPTGLTLSREELEVHASGRISTIFGEQFEQQDAHARQVRMPEPPLLLADRVTGLTGEPGTMGKGTVWTETDVTADAWYLYQGRMPAGIMVESGQADLLLISWLGADFHNKGERVYRLLGCDLTCHGPLPRIGDTLQYDIHVDAHAKQGDVRLFFFHYDCRIDGEVRLSVRSGQAGFFTDEELEQSRGILWSAEDAEPTPEPRLDPPPVQPTVDHLDADAVQQLVEGDVYGVFGEGYERAAAHTATPTIQGGKMTLLDSVPVLEPEGGPWGRGYLKARLGLTPDHWFFDGHFKNDPCMPGTLMFEGCLQAMSLYMMALGYTLPRDGWRFEPVSDVKYELRCRGQAIPSSDEVTYEIFVDEIGDGPQPILWADILGSVDGRKAFWCRRMGLQLVPGWPLEEGRRDHPLPTSDRPVAVEDGFAFDDASILACAVGRPSTAFGEPARPFDGPRKVSRLPGPPYHLMSRIARVQGGQMQLRVGSEVQAEYDVPADAWYFTDNGCRTIPFAVLTEIALQPCGWLAQYVGASMVRDQEVYIRNLDGDGQVLGEVGDDAERLVTTATLTSLSNLGDLTLVAFDVQLHEGDRSIADLTTSFGFFPLEALRNQVGLPTTDEQVARVQEPSDVAFELADRPDLTEGSPRLPVGDLGMLHRVTGLWAEGGAHDLGRIRAERDIDPRDWYFKAHFFQDPVMPGSLGLEAMVQAVQLLAIEAGHAPEGTRFEAVAAGEEVQWRYRGQVVPEADTVVVDLDLAEVADDEGGTLLVAEGSLWVDGKRIYHTPRMTVRAVPAGADPADRSGRAASGSGDPTPRLLRQPIDLEALRAYWREAWRAEGPWAGEDLMLDLIDRFARDLVFEGADLPAALRGRSAIYLANHQVASETALGAVILGGALDAPVTVPAKAEHRDTWVGQLSDLMQRYPHAAGQQPVRFVDRSDPASMLAFVRETAHSLTDGRSMLVHVDGTRSLSCRQPVRQVSTVLLDLAVELGLPVVPLKFVGGLPVEPAEQRLDLPLGYTAQDLWIGRPIAAAALADLPFPERAPHVLAALRDLGPADEVPNPPDPAFGERVERWRQRLGGGDIEAALAAALEAAGARSVEGERLLAALRADESIDGDDPVSAWLREVRDWLGGRPS